MSETKPEVSVSETAPEDAPKISETRPEPRAEDVIALPKLKARDARTLQEISKGEPEGPSYLYFGILGSALTGGSFAFARLRKGAAADLLIEKLRADEFHVDTRDWNESNLLVRVKWGISSLPDDKGSHGDHA